MARTNRLQERIDDGEAALGVLDSVYSPSLVEFYGELGVDFVWIDLEHGGPSPRDGEALADLLRAADAGGTELLVRLPTADPAGVRKALDAGVRNLFISRVETPEEVRRAVEAGRFRYDDGPGKRGLANPRASRWGLADDYVAEADRETMIGVTVETPSSIERIDELLDVPDLGFVFLGPLDLSVAFGRPGEPTDPEVEDAVEEVREAAIERGVPVGGLGFGPDDVNEKVEAGYRIVNLGSTTGAIQGTVEGWLDETRG